MPWTWPHFSREEMRCRCGCGRADVDPAFMDRLELLRVEYGKPMIVTSGFRCEDHNAAVAGKARSGHLTGMAVDIHLASQRDADRIIELAYKHGFGGKGARLHGHVGGWTVHLDTLPRKAIWTYP